LRFSQAVGEAIAQEMEADQRVLILGEDIGRCGGVFGVTRGLLDRFGEWRVRHTPISEMGSDAAGAVQGYFENIGNMLGEMADGDPNAAGRLIFEVVVPIPGLRRIG